MNTVAGNGRARLLLVFPDVDAGMRVAYLSVLTVATTAQAERICARPVLCAPSQVAVRVFLTSI